MGGAALQVGVAHHAAGPPHPEADGRGYVARVEAAPAVLLHGARPARRRPVPLLRHQGLLEFFSRHTSIMDLGKTLERGKPAEFFEDNFLLAKSTLFLCHMCHDFRIN